MVPVKCVPGQDTSFILGPSLNIPNNVKKAGVHYRYLQTFLGIHTFTKLAFSFWHQIQISIVSIMPVHNSRILFLLFTVFQLAVSY